MALVLRSTKGSPLSLAEGDGNFVHLQDQIDVLSLGAERIPSNRFIGGFTNSSNTLPSNLSSSQLAIIGDDIYLFGGYSDSAALNIIYKSNISNPTSWINTGATLPSNLHGHNLLYLNNKLYIYGGHNGSAYVNTIRVADLNTYERPIYRKDGVIYDFVRGVRMSDHELSGIVPWIIAA